MNEKPFYDYYEFFQLEITASEKAIYDAWKEAKNLYSIYNPKVCDHFSEQELDQLCKIADEAYNILSHPVKRAAYNEVLSRKYPNKYKNTVKLQREIDDELKDEIHATPFFDGDFIKKIREHMDCSIDELSAITRIKPHYIQALENNCLEDLPAPVFVRGYVAQISKVFGLDEKTVCNSYMNFFHEQNRETQSL